MSFYETLKVAGKYRFYQPLFDEDTGAPVRSEAAQELVNARAKAKFYRGALDRSVGLLSTEPTTEARPVEELVTLLNNGEKITPIEQGLLLAEVNVLEAAVAGKDAEDEYYPDEAVYQLAMTVNPKGERATASLSVRPIIGAPTGDWADPSQTVRMNMSDAAVSCLHRVAQAAVDGTIPELVKVLELWQTGQLAELLSAEATTEE